MTSTTCDCPAHVRLPQSELSCGRVEPTGRGLRDYYEDSGRRFRYVPECDPLEAVRVQLVLRLLPRRAGRSVLDVGCGDGYLCDRLGSRGYRGVVGLDLARTRLAYASARYPDLALLQSDVIDLPFADATFDVVTCVEVLEHVPDAAGALAELARVSKRYVICTTPYCEDVSENFCPHCGNGFPPAGHLHRFDEHRFEDMGQRAGLRLKRWRQTHPILEHRRFRWLPPLRWLVQGYYRSDGFIGVLFEKV